jgi:hypothetical protein
VSRGKYLSHEEARQRGLLEGFAKEHPTEGDEKLFDRLLAAISRRRANQMISVFGWAARFASSIRSRQADLSVHICGGRVGGRRSIGLGAEEHLDHANAGRVKTGRAR